MSDSFLLDQVATIPNPNCMLCGGSGTVLHKGLYDRLFAVPGSWNLDKCPHCGLVWLDPMPRREEVHKLYATYYTHQESRQAIGGNRLKRLLWKVLRGIYGAVERLTPIYYQRDRAFLMFLNEAVPGKLLEVGCGSGARLARLRNLGWQVEGQEVDPKAANFAAQNHHLTVHLGELESLSLPAGSFDAVTISHVIEHVPDPVALLAESYRLLKPGGVLVAVTPNSESFGHRHFGGEWLQLDPPRHLHLFSPPTLRQLALMAGITNPTTWTTAANAQFFALASIEIGKTGHYTLGAKPGLVSAMTAVLYQAWASLVHFFRSDSGDECVLKAVKMGPR